MCDRVRSSKPIISTSAETSSFLASASDFTASLFLIRLFSFRLMIVETNPRNAPPPTNEEYMASNSYFTSIRIIIFSTFYQGAGLKQISRYNRGNNQNHFVVVCGMLNIIVGDHGTVPAGNGSM